MKNIDKFHQSEKIKKDVGRVEKKVQEVKERVESKFEDKEKASQVLDNEKEIVKQSVSELADEEIKKKMEEPSSEEDEYLADYLEEEEVSDQTKEVIESLLQLAVDKGVFVALRRSKKFPPFVQDAFHDSLVDKLLPKLKEKGIL